MPSYPGDYSNPSRAKFPGPPPSSIQPLDLYRRPLDISSKNALAERLTGLSSLFEKLLPFGIRLDCFLDGFA